MNSTRALVADVIPSSCVDGPGNRYVLFLQGCSFNCLACQNPQTIGTHSTETTRWSTVDDVLADIEAVAPFLSGVTVSGGEATLQWEFLVELFGRMRATPATARLTRLVDSNGDAEPMIWIRLAPVMEGAMIDLKALDADVHHLLTGHANDRVLAALHQLDQLDRLAEVRLLLVPGVNDSPDQLARTARFLSTLRSRPTVAVLGFRHEGTRAVARQFRAATDDDITRATSELVAAGLPPDRIVTRLRTLTVATAPADVVDVNP
jgi:pyruvate formate lyase activating enzyme